MNKYEKCNDFQEFVHFHIQKECVIGVWSNTWGDSLKLRSDWRWEHYTLWPQLLCQCINWVSPRCIWGSVWFGKGRKMTQKDSNCPLFISRKLVYGFRCWQTAKFSVSDCYRLFSSAYITDSVNTFTVLQYDVVELLSAVAWRCHKLSSLVDVKG